MSWAMTLDISSELIVNLLGDAQKAAPNECCGIMFGANMSVTGILACRNVHPNPSSHFEIDPAALITAAKNERAGFDPIIGYYHSHPNGRRTPSDEDWRDAAHDDRIWAIIAAGEVTFWRDTVRGFVSEPTKVI